MQNETMSCKTFSQNIDAYIDGELDKQRSEQILLHMQECDECRALYEQRIEMCACLGALPDVPKDFSRSWKSAIKEESSKKVVSFKFWRTAITAVASVAAAIVLWNGYVTILKPKPPEDVTVNVTTESPSPEDQYSDEALSPRRSDPFTCAIAPSMWNNVPKGEGVNLVSMIIDMRGSDSEIIEYVSDTLKNHASNYVIQDSVAYVSIASENVDPLVSMIQEEYLLSKAYVGEDNKDIVLRILE